MKRSNDVFNLTAAFRKKNGGWEELWAVSGRMFTLSNFRDYTKVADEEVRANKFARYRNY